MPVGTPQRRGARGSRRRRGGHGRRSGDELSRTDLHAFVEQTLARIQESLKQIQRDIRRITERSRDAQENAAEMEIKTAPLVLTPDEADAFDELTSRRAPRVAKPLPLDQS